MFREFVETVGVIVILFLVAAFILLVVIPIILWIYDRIKPNSRKRDNFHGRVRL